MNINQLNHLLLIVGMTIAVTFGASESSSDENYSASVRSRRGLDSKEMRICINYCINNHQLIAKPKVKYTKIQKTTECIDYCNELSNSDLTALQQETRVKTAREPIYYDPSKGIPAALHNCEIKCLAERDEQSGVLGTARISLCRQRCANFA